MFRFLGILLSYAVLYRLASPKPQGPPAPNRPSETFLQNDLNRTVEYRKEYYKYVIGIATALLAFTISFQPQLSVHPEKAWLEFIGWGGLGIAVVASVRVHMVWAKFFVSFRNHDNRGDREQGKRVRHRLNMERRMLDFAQMLGLIIGVAGVVAFTSVNLKHIAVKADEPKVLPAAGERCNLRPGLPLCEAPARPLQALTPRERQ